MNPRITSLIHGMLTRDNIRLMIEIFGFVVTLISIWFLIAQLDEQTKATKAQIEAIQAQYQSIDASVYQDLMTKQLELNKIFIENETAAEQVFSTKYKSINQLSSAAVSTLYYHLDFYEFIYSQRSRLSALQDEEGESWITWKNTMKKGFKSIPLLCRTLEESKELYGKQLKDAALSENGWCHDDKPKLNR